MIIGGKGVVRLGLVGRGVVGLGAVGEVVEGEGVVGEGVAISPNVEHECPFLLNQSTKSSLLQVLQTSGVGP